MKFKSTLLLAIILTITTFASAQKADPPKPAAVKLPAVSEILAKYVKAIGGREAFEKIKTRMMTGTVEIVPMGIKGTFESYTAAEGKAYTKMNLAGIGESLDVSDGKSAWTVNPIQGSREKTGAELAQSKISGNFYRDINIDKIYQKLEVTGIEKVGTKDAYVVVATNEGIPSDTFYFDTDSGLIVRSDSTSIVPEGNVAAKMFIEERRTVDGVSVPVKTRTQLTQFEIIMNVTEVKNGVVIDDSKFTKPKQ